MKLKSLTATFFFSISVVFYLPAALAGSGEVSLIHIGELHGHMVPRPNVRSDTSGEMEGGLARMYTVVKKLRSQATYADCKGKDCKQYNHSLLLSTGDMVQGSGEALFSRGQVIIDVLNLFDIDAHAPGNWDFLYYPARFEESFKGNATSLPLANWNAMASNLYYESKFDDDAICAVKAIDSASGTLRPLQRVLPPYMIKQIGKVKIAVVAYTTARAIATIGPKVTAGYRFTDGKLEYPCFVDRLRNVEKVDLLVMISELEMAKNIQLASTFSGVDVILNSDMHERTTQPIVTRLGTVIVEEGQDGTMIGSLKLTVKNGVMTQWKWKPFIVTSEFDADKRIAAKVAAVRKPYLKHSFVPGQTVVVGGNTATLQRPVDEVIAVSMINLHRSNFVHEEMPGVVEGSSHNLITDAMRWAAGTDAASIRGFRYGTHIPAGGMITMNDIYHYIPIAAKLGKSPKACGFDLKLQAENSTNGVFNPDPSKWTGGWMFGYSNVTFDLDACAGYGIDGPNGATERATNIKVGGIAIDPMDKYNPTTAICASGVPGYSVAGYWYADDPNTQNNCDPCRGRLIEVTDTKLNTVTAWDPTAATHPLPDTNSLLDVTEAVVKYLRALPSKGGLGGVVTKANLPVNRITVKRLPTIKPYRFDMIQPLHGATAKTCPALN